MNINESFPSEKKNINKFSILGPRSDMRASARTQFERQTWTMLLFIFFYTLWTDSRTSKNADERQQSVLLNYYLEKTVSAIRWIFFPAGMQIRDELNSVILGNFPLLRTFKIRPNSCHADNNFSIANISHQLTSPAILPRTHTPFSRKRLQYSWWLNDDIFTCSL